MRRLFLVLLLVFQPLQWGWANAHVVSEAAHMVSHSSQEVSAMLTAPIGSVLHDTDQHHAHGTKHNASHHHDSASESTSGHDHHSHYLTVLALGTQELPCLGASTPLHISQTSISHPDCPVFSRIERPKWPYPASAVVISIHHAPAVVSL